MVIKNKFLLQLLKKNKVIFCKNCGWSWRLSQGGKYPYLCHKCKYANNK
jgi:hypothetical protein